MDKSSLWTHRRVTRGCRIGGADPDVPMLGAYFINDCSKLAPTALARPQEHIAASPGPGATGQRVGGLHDGEAEPPHALRAAVISASGARQKCWRRRQHRAPPSAELPPATAGLSPGGMGREDISRTGGGTRFVARSRSRSTCLQGTLHTVGLSLHRSGRRSHGAREALAGSIIDRTSSNDRRAVAVAACTESLEHLRVAGVAAASLTGHGADSRGVASVTASGACRGGPVVALRALAALRLWKWRH